MERGPPVDSTEAFSVASYFLLCSCCSAPHLPPELERAEEGPCRVKETPDQLCSPPPSMHLPTGSSPGTENYLCLQIAFDSRELFLWPANRSGDENYPACKLGIQGRQMKMQ